MRPSKSKSTRYQPRALYLVATLLFCASLLVGYSLEYDLPWINHALALIPSNECVHWRSRDQAWRECQKTRKPILYIILSKNDPGSSLLDAQCLGDAKVAELIEADFIPVVYWEDRKKRNPDLGPDYKYYNDKLGMTYESLPWIAAVPYSLHDARPDDLNSSANLVELGVTNIEALDSDEISTVNAGSQNYTRQGKYADGRFMGIRGGGISFGYTGKQDFLDFLYGARLWHKLPPTVGRINWLPLANLNLESQSAKPKLIAFVGEVGAASDSMRLDLFWKNHPVDLINKKFDPYLIEFRRQDPAFNSKYNQLKKKYNIEKLPALLVLNSPSKSESGPPVEHGFDNVGFTMEFLKSALKPGPRAQVVTTPVYSSDGTDSQ